MVLLPEKGYMGLDVTGHRPVFEIPQVIESTVETTNLPLSETEDSGLPELPPEPQDQTQDQAQEDSYK